MTTGAILPTCSHTEGLNHEVDTQLARLSTVRRAELAANTEQKTMNEGNEMSEAKTKPIKSGTQWYHYGNDIKRMGALKAKQTPTDAGVFWWLFRGALVRQAMDWMRANGNDPDGTRCGHEHDCCGCFNVSSASIQVQSGKVLIKQTGARNI